MCVGTECRWALDSTAPSCFRDRPGSQSRIHKSTSPGRPFTVHADSLTTTPATTAPQRCYLLLACVRALACFSLACCSCRFDCCCLLFSLSFLPPLSPMVAPSGHYGASGRRRQRVFNNMTTTTP